MDYSGSGYELSESVAVRERERKKRLQETIEFDIVREVDATTGLPMEDIWRDNWKAFIDAHFYAEQKMMKHMRKHHASGCYDPRTKFSMQDPRLEKSQVEVREGRREQIRRLRLVCFW